MAKPERECGCPTELWRCHHELAEVRKKAVAALSYQESVAAGVAIKDLLSERPEERRDLPLPSPITAVYSPPPGSGKRK